MTVNPGHSTCLICELDKDWRREMDSISAEVRVGGNTRRWEPGVFGAIDREDLIQASIDGGFVQ